MINTRNASISRHHVLEVRVKVDNVELEALEIADVALVLVEKPVEPGKVDK